MNEKEIYYIKKYQSCDYRFGYNMKEGGKGGKTTNKTKLRMLQGQNIKPIYCSTTCEIFLCATDAGEKYNINSKKILKKCNDNQYCEKSFYNNELKTFLEFEYCVLPNSMKGHKTPIICVTQNKVFRSISEANKYYSFNKNHLIYLLRRNRIKHKKVIVVSVTYGELEFMYLYDFVVENY